MLGDPIADSKDYMWRANKIAEFSKKPEKYLQGVVETGEKVFRYLKFRSFLKMFNYGGSKIIEPLEEYRIALQVLSERDLEDSSLATLLQESKKGFFEDLFEWGSKTPKGIRKNVAKRILEKRTPKWNRQLFPDFSD